MTVTSAAAPTELLIGIGVTTTALEVFSERRQYLKGGFFDMPAALSETLVPAWLTSLMEFVGRKNALLVLFTVRALAGLLLIYAFFNSVSSWIVGCAAMALFITGILFYLAHSYGHDGADQMTQNIVGPLGAAQLTGHDWALYVAMFFIAAQCLNSYVTSGVSKWFGPLWRNGSALHLILRTRSYGTLSLANILKSNPLGEKVLTYAVLCYETLFFVCLLFPFKLLVLWLTAGILLHISFAVFMGLNNFVWAFLAAYPAIVVANDAGRRFLNIG